MQLHKLKRRLRNINRMGIKLYNKDRITQIIDKFKEEEKTRWGADTCTQLNILDAMDELKEKFA